MKELSPIPTNLDTNSSILEQHIRICHAQATEAAESAVLAAAKCGLLLIEAKALIPYGDFEKWFAQARFGFSRMTRSKYMRLAEGLCNKGKSKPGLLLKLELNPDGMPTSVCFEEAALKTMVNNLCAGKGLARLYGQGDGARRAREDQNDPKDAAPSEEKQLPQKVYRNLLWGLELLPAVIADLGSDETTELRYRFETAAALVKTARPRDPGAQEYEKT